MKRREKDYIQGVSSKNLASSNNQSTTIDVQVIDPIGTRPVN